MTWMPAILARLIADTPSLAAAAKAGRATSISAIVWRACQRCEGCRGEVLDAAGNRVGCLHPTPEYRGRISFHAGDWRRHLPRWLHQMAAQTQGMPTPSQPGEGRVLHDATTGRIIVQYVDQNGREIERVTH